MKNNFTAYILAGGQSRRIGYDKLMTPICKVSLLEKTLNTCRQVCWPVKFAAKETEKFSGINVDVVIDNPTANGPLAGIIASLENCNNDYCFITAADFYDLDSIMIEKLINKYNNEPCLTYEINNRTQPLCSIYNKSTLPILKKAAVGNNYKMIDILDKLNTRTISIDITPWRNINNPEDLDNIRREHV